MNEDIRELFDYMKEKFDFIDQKFNFMDQKFDSMDQKFDSMDQKFDSMEQKFDSMDQNFDSLKSDIKKIDLKLENETNKNIQLLAEGYAEVTENSKRLKAIEERVDNIQTDVSIIKKVVVGHSREIEKLAKVE